VEEDTKGGVILEVIINGELAERKREHGSSCAKGLMK
jgi:hypothetical protein